MLDIIEAFIAGTYVSRYVSEFPHPPADLNALGPGYEFPLDLVTIPQTT